MNALLLFLLRYYYYYYYYYYIYDSTVALWKVVLLQGKWWPVFQACTTYSAGAIGQARRQDYTRVQQQQWWRRRWRWRDDGQCQWWRDGGEDWYSSWRRWRRSWQRRWGNLERRHRTEFSRGSGHLSAVWTSQNHSLRRGENVRYVVMVTCFLLQQLLPWRHYTTRQKRGFIDSSDTFGCDLS